MIPMTLGEIADAVHGHLHGADPSAQVLAVTEDSRQVAPGALFVALPGTRADGHDFISAACAAGAVAALATRAGDGPRIIVDDAELALGRLAAAVRTHLKCRVIAITGSSGKTSTKDLLAQVLQTQGETVASAGSQNNELGCPLTILRADANTRFLVLEMGMRGEGQLDYLCDIARPEIGVIVNVGTAHLGVLGSREAIARAKGEVIACLPADGTAVIYGDDPIVAAQAVRTRAQVVTFGEAVDDDIRATDLRLDAGARPSFTLHAGDQAEPVTLQFAGAHYALNALAAAAAALRCGLDIEQVAMGLRAATPQSRWRMEVHEAPSGITVVNDAYNANPESMRAALTTLQAMAAGRRTWAVLGEMRELGEASALEHAEVGRLAQQVGVTRLVCIGALGEEMHSGATDAGHVEADAVPDVDAAIALLRRELAPGDVVLVKASRSVGLERVALALMEEVSA